MDKRKQFTQEFSEKRQEISEKSQQVLNEVSELFSQKKALTKAEKDEIIRKLNWLNMNIGTNLDFIANQFNEQMDKTITEAKGEIEAFCQNKINSIASASLVEHKDELLNLENPVLLDKNIE